MRYIVFEVLHMYKTFGETIASLRRAHGMRQQALAEAVAEAGLCLLYTSPSPRD